MDKASYDFSQIIDERRFRLLESRMTDNSSDSLDNSLSNMGDQMDTSNSSFSSTTSDRKKKRNFTPDEDEAIIQGYNKFTDDWDKILEYTKLERTTKQIKSRFTRLRKTRAPELEPPPSAKRQKTNHHEVNESDKIQSIEEQELHEVQMLLQKKEQEINELTFQNKQYKDQVISLQKKVKQQKEQLDKQAEEDDKETSNPSNMNLDVSIHDHIQHLVTKNADSEFKLRRLQVWENSSRLGKLVAKPRGHSLVEDWEDGFAFQELDINRKHVISKKDKLENKRKELSKTKSSLKGKISSVSSTLSDHPLNSEYEQLLLSEEVLKHQVTILKREENEMNQQLQQLIIERNFHRKQYKLVHDQEKSHFNNHPLLHRRYVLENLLGCGGFSEVYAAYDLLRHQTVACKIHQLNKSWSKQKKDNYQKHALREHLIQKSIISDRVVRLFDVFELDETSFCTILEYCNDGDLDSRLKERNKLPEKETRCIIAQILEGLTYLNKIDNPIIHYDLKPGNILFHDGEVKITDFGLSKIVENTDDGMVELTSQGAGTYGYLPPECSGFAKSKISSKVDVWSLGVVCYQMLFGKKPFGTNNQIPFRAELEFPGKISDDCKQFIQKCLTQKQAARPDVFTIARHPFVVQKK